MLTTVGLSRSSVFGHCAFRASCSRSLGQLKFSTSRAIGLSASRPALNAATKDTSALSWNEFLALRSKRRRVNTVCSIFTAFGAVTIGWGFVSNIEIDPTQMIFGFDPFWVYGGGLFALGGFSYLLGPVVGESVFKLMIRKQYPSFVQKNTEFLKHIKANRPDPSKQSYVNPVVDYYGEKIGSLKDYRRWLRDGRVYRKKSEKFL